MKKSIFLAIILSFFITRLAYAPPPGKLTVAWNPVSTMVSGIPTSSTVTYRVFRSNSSTGPWTLIVSTTMTNFLDTGLQPNKTYFYYVTAVVNMIESNRSGTASGKT